MNDFITGYVGTDSMPNCTTGVCWYVYHNTYSITE